MGLVLMLGLVGVGDAQSTNPHVFNVRASGGDCQQQRSLTGFRVEGRPGIVTALHGVSGCTNISATLVNGSDSEAHYGLLATEVSVPLDIAVLTSPELLAHPLDGLPSLPRDEALADLDHNASISLIGYPIESNQVELFRISLTRPSLATIRDRIDAAIPALQARRSPDVDVPLLSLEGSIYPGHSGAPLLYEGRVVGVALGGIRGGGALGWAVRWIDVQDRLVPVADPEAAAELARLARDHPADVAFAIDRDETLQIRLQTGENQFREAIINEVADMSSEYVLGHSELDPDFVVNVYIEQGGTLVARGALGATMEALDRRFESLRFRVIKDGVFVLQVLRRVAIPDVAGLPVEQASDDLERIGLSVGEILDEASNEVPAEAVIGTIPDAGTEVEFGSAVDVRLSRGPPTVAVPRLEGMASAAEAAAALEGLGLTMRPVWAFSEHPDGYVMASEPPGQTEVVVGSGIDVRVSRGRANVGVMAALSGRSATIGLMIFDRVRVALEANATNVSICDYGSSTEAAELCARRFVDEEVDLVMIDLGEAARLAPPVLDRWRVPYVIVGMPETTLEVRQQLDAALARLLEQGP